MPTEKEIKQALSGVVDPEIGRNIIELNMVRDLKIEKNGAISFTLALTIPGCPLREKIRNDARNALLALEGVKSVDVTFGVMSEEERKAIFGQAALPKLNSFNEIKHVVAVMSGKGGVGKSSVTAMLATALRQKGHKVGVLDADITGPSIPKLFGLPPGGLRSAEQGFLPAVSAEGIKIVSINLLLPDESMPVVWRGPIISGTIRQFWEEALWGKLDYLLVDLPPGTSDATLTVLQNLPLDGILMVTTPQGLASMVVRKAVNMVRQMNACILGVVENMSYFTCPDTGKPHNIFGESHAPEVAEASACEVWARLPIDPQVAALCDAGKVGQVHLGEMDTLAQKVEAALS